MGIVDVLYIVETRIPTVDCLISVEQSCKSEVIRLVNISQLLIETLLILIIHINLAIEVEAYFREQDGFTNLGLLALFERFSRSAKCFILIIL